MNDIWIILSAALFNFQDTKHLESVMLKQSTLLKL